MRLRICLLTEIKRYKSAIRILELELGRRLNLFIGNMYNRYTCPLQPCTHLTLKLLIQGHPRSAEVTHIADFKSAYISLIIGPGRLQCETNL